MKILIISQNTCPLQSPRAFRTQELSEELVRQGHEVTLYTVHGGIDYSEYEKKTGILMKNIKPLLPIESNDGKRRYSVFQRLLYHFFHRIFFYPEVDFHFRVDSILKSETNIDLLITIAYPHTIHSGAAKSKLKHPRTFPKVWIADCGDPFYLNRFVNAPRYMERYERQWCEVADWISVPTEGSKEGYFPEYKDKICVIPQGFDFSKTPIARYTKNSVITFVFCGSVYPGKRDIRSFMDFLLRWDKPYKFKLLLRSPLDNKYEIESNHQIEYVVGKNRKEVIWECSKADFLINIKNPNNTQTPSKLIDYGISGRPVLDVSHVFCEQKQFDEFYRGDYHNQHYILNLEHYKIKTVAGQFIELANNLKKY